MAIYALTKVGKRLAKKSVGEDGKSKILSFLLGNHTAESSELEIIGGSDALYPLERRGLICRLDSGGSYG